MTYLVIEAGRTERAYLHDLWRYRELFYVLAWRDIAVRYKQTAIGFVWALLQPLLTMAVLTVVFSKLARMSSGSTPYPLLVMAGAVPWQFFANSLTNSSQSLIGNSNLISKIYFPRLIVPTSAVVTAGADFLIAFGLLVPMMAWYHVVPTGRIVLLPFAIILAFVAALGPGLLVTALNVKYRDFRYIIPFVVQFGTYLSPVGFTSAVVPERWRWLYSLNPMVGVIDGFRWCLLGGTNRLDVTGIAISTAAAGTLLYVGLRHFRRTERSFADVI